MASVKYQGVTAEYTADGKSSVIVYHGTREQMEALAGAHHVNEFSEEGRLAAMKVSQSEGPIWDCEFRYDSSTDWQSKERPSTEWGVKTAQLRGSMLSMPLEAHPNYRANWNYYLVAAPEVTQSPAFWLNATDTLLTQEDQESYCWCRTPGERPNTKDGLWYILFNPQKPGVSSYDVATYSVTETARFRSNQAAGKMVAGKLNRIGTPVTVFGITGGNWKCDDASVVWDGKYWLATLTWTRSGNDAGWDSDLYS